MFLRIHILFVAIALVTMCASAHAGGAAGNQPGYVGPELDPVLMGNKEFGTWYFLCDAPQYGNRIPPHYATYAPPSRSYCPPPPPQVPPQCGPPPNYRK
jgi:hypothetical protein